MRVSVSGFAVSAGAGYWCVQKILEQAEIDAMDRAWLADADPEYPPDRYQKADEEGTAWAMAAGYWPMGERDD
jgi:hypothetical protein